MRLRTFFSLIAGCVMVLPAMAQAKRDTVKIPLAKSSQIIFTVGDKSDLETLKHYNFQDLFADIIAKLEKSEREKADTVPVVKADTTKADSLIVVERNNDNWATLSDDDDDNDDDDDWEWHDTHRRSGRTRHSINFDIGMNNYIQNGDDSAKYAVRPWGSWYFGISSTQRTRLGRKFFLEWAGGISWYTFKFENPNTVILRDENGVKFVTENTPGKDFDKSKLGVTYLHASLVPVVDFGDHNRKTRIWNGDHRSFRIGLGPYVGYRIASLTKVKYTENDDTQKDKDHSNLYLNNLRYGARLQLGFRSTDFFFNYDLNELFMTGKGPDLNAFSFGIIF